MDPTANLKEQRRIKDKLLKTPWSANAHEPGDIEELAFRLAELVEALDNWLMAGGFLPEPWLLPQATATRIPCENRLIFDDEPKPLYLNGYLVVERTQLPKREGMRSGAIVLVDRGVNVPDRWVTAWHGDGDKEWGQGHYFDNRCDAFRDFEGRIAKWWRL